MNIARTRFLLTAFAMTLVASHDTCADPEAAGPGGSLPKAAEARLVTPRMIAEALELPCPEVRIPRKAPLSKVLASISRHMSEQSGIPILFVVDYMELELEGLKSLSDVTVGDLNLPSGSHTCREAIRLLLSQTREPELVIVPRLRHILVTSVAASELPENFIVRAYDVGSLLQPGRPADDSGPPGENTLVASPEARDQPTSDAARPPGVRFASSRELRQILVDHTAPTVFWMEVLGDEGGYVSTYGNHLIVRHSRQAHDVVRIFLENLQNEPLR